MVTDRTVIYEYEQILTGKRKNFSEVTINGNLENRRKAGAVAWRYAVKNILHWPAEQAARLFSLRLVKALKLDTTLKFMKIDYTANAFIDFREILSFAFPDEIHYDVEEQARDEYKRILKIDEFENDMSRHKFHKGFFSGEEGGKRTQTVVNYAIERFMGNVTDYELYSFFGSDEAIRWCNEYRIGKRDIPGFRDPLELMHFTLPDSDADYLLYLNERLKQHIKGTGIAKAVSEPAT